MNGFIRHLIIGAMIASLISCASQPIEDDLALDYSEDSQEFAVSDETSVAAEDDFSEFEDEDIDKPASTASTADSGQELSLEDEFSEAGVEPEAPAEQTAEVPPPVEEPTTTAESFPEEDPFAEDTSVAETPAPAPPEPQIDESAFETTSQETVETVPEPAPEPMTNPVKITNLQFKGNANGGTVVVEADRPLSYTTRTNPELGQFIVEVDNAILPDKLKRSLNTRDIKGSFGAIDAYQNPGASTARFVIQLRPGVMEPAVQNEGNSLLIMASTTPAETPGDTAQVAEVDTGSETGAQSLGSQTLSEFLAGNNKFYGKKISIETNNMDIRDALNFITEESGVNMVISEDVRGNISLKLRQVPWDQALVVIMRAKKLGYVRQGNVLRIAPLTDLKAEEDDANKLIAARKNLEPLKVRMFPISYAKVDELEKKIKDFLGERGKAVGDVRTNALVVTDIQENLDRVAKLIVSLDTQPPQVLIEGKIVEASEDFTRKIGVSWAASGAPVQLSKTARGPLNMTPSLNINPGAGSGSTGMNFGLNIGTLDVLGNLTAALALSETESLVKVISSPRIVTMTNEKADINQTTEVPIRQVTVNNGVTQTTYQFKPLVLKLEVTPQVTADGSVIMKVTVNRQFAGANISQDSDAFPVNSREANTKVLVKNGETAVIGGIYQSDAQNGETGVPWFKDVPVVGYLFKSKDTRKQKSELLIFLTPRIMGQLEVPNHDGESPVL
ncbi:Type IV pilus biogenesis and competence protein PilQ precursor [compost metagenome]